MFASHDRSPNCRRPVGPAGEGPALDENTARLPLCAQAWRRDGNQALTLTEAAVPMPLPGEALVRVHAAGLNPVDFKARQSTGVDGVGEVVRIGGSEASSLEIGDRVMFHASLLAMGSGRPEVGAFSHYAVAPLAALARIPDQLSYEQAAALPCPAGTAYQIAENLEAVLHSASRVQRGAVFVQSASGAVGRFVVQLLKLRHPDLLVIGSASPGANHDDLRQLQVAPISYKNEAGQADSAAEISNLRGVLAAQARSLLAVVNFQGAQSAARHFGELGHRGMLVCVLGLPHLVRSESALYQPMNNSEAEQKKAAEIRAMSVISPPARLAPTLSEIALGAAYGSDPAQVPVEDVREMAAGYAHVAALVSQNLVTLPSIVPISFAEIGVMLARQGTVEGKPIARMT